ncbi:acyl-CoA dehydrogenase family protein [Thalassovita sp.]|uniref:acyl-CoA dehydrogenase family protein n=1 Tax=Thalassovita sp. TaxID=1979401 RepID=UPI0029DE736D|nr:acyl-CoA dehydrogenase family protein [Thalassovita sp.]
MLEESARQVFDTHCGPDVVRAIEAGGPVGTLWQELESVGFADALRPETGGGAGLSWSDVGVVLMQAGAYALPVPLGQTMAMRAVMSGTDISGPITIAPVPAQRTKDGVFLRTVPFGRVAAATVAMVEGDWVLLPVGSAQVTPAPVHGSLTADLTWMATPAPTPLPGIDWVALGALLTAVTMAGTMMRVLDMTVAYVVDRQQFGKPIGRQQAVQQQLAVMAEEVYAARMAASLGLSLPDIRTGAALAKSRVSEAAAKVGPIAHAVHGAIGIAAETDLNLFTRRLIEGRTHYGNANHWYKVLGQAALDSGQGPFEHVDALARTKRLPRDI